MNQLKAGAFLNYVIIALNIIVGLIYTPFMLRMMGQSEFGLYSLVASIISYLTVLDLGMGNTVIRYTAKLRSEGNTEGQYEMFGLFLSIYLIIGIVALIAGFVLYQNVEYLFGETMTQEEIFRAKIMMLILTFNLAATFPLSIFGSIITAYELFVFPKVVNLVRTVLNMVTMVILLLMGYKAVAMVIVLTVFNILSLTINFVYCKVKLKIKIKRGAFKWDFLKEVAIYSFWIFLNVIMEKIYWSTGQFVLGAVSGTIAVSVFAIAIQLEGMYMTFSTAISSVFLPKVTSMVTKNLNKREISELFIRTGRIQNLIMSFILFGFIIFGEYFIKLWAGDDYSEAYYMTIAFFVSLYVPLIQNLGITILQARNQMKFRSLLYIILAFFALIVEIAFSKRWGGIGCAMAVSLALIIGQGIIMNIYYYRKQAIDILKFWKEIIKMNIVPFFFSVASFFVIFYFCPCETWFSFILSISIYSIAYFLICMMFSINKEEKNLILAPIFRVVS